MSGSAKKRREKERQRGRRHRGELRRAVEFARKAAEFHQEFERLIDEPHGRVPGFSHEIVFAPGRGEPVAPHVTVAIDGRDVTADVFPASRPM